MQALPSWMTTILLAALLTFISYKLLARGFITWRDESSEAKHHKSGEATEPLLQGNDDATEGQSGKHQHHKTHWPEAQPKETAFTMFIRYWTLLMLM